MMKKLENKYKFLKLMAVSITCLLIFFSLPFVHNNLASKIIQKSLSGSGFKIENLDIILGYREIKVKNVRANIGQTNISIPNLNVEYSLKNLFFSRKTNFEIKSDLIEINDSKLEFNFNVNGIYNSRTGNVNFDGKSESLKIDQSLKGISSLRLSLNAEIGNNIISLKKIDLKINDGVLKGFSEIENGYFGLNSLMAEFNLQNIPIKLYKAFLSENSGLYKFLNQSISGGLITDSKINLNLPKEFLSKTSSFSEEELEQSFLDQYLDAEINLADLKYSYSPYMPPIDAALAKILIKGKMLTVKLLDADIAGSKTNFADIWLNFLSPKIAIYAKGEITGPASTLIRFIEPEKILQMKNSDIDLEAIKGLAKSTIDITIPLQAELPNLYNVESKISGVNLAILGDRLKLDNYSLNGKFDGDKLIISGRGNINNLKSSCNVNINISDKTEFSHQIKSSIILENSGNNIPGIQVISGKTNLDVELISKNDVTTLTAKANLKPVHFFIDSISLHKEEGKKANFKLDGIIQEGKSQKLNMLLSGEDGLQISGYLNTENHHTILNFKQVQYLNNNFSAKITTTSKSLDVDVDGDLIDLSETNFSEIMSRESKEYKSSKIKINIKKVKMKNKVNFDDLLYLSECYEQKCPVSRFRTSIDDVDYASLEYVDSEKPKWVLESNNGGKLLKSLGISKNVRGGELAAYINAPISKTSDKGYKTDGFVRFKNFETTKNKFLTRMVGFISIPGLIGTLTNSNVPFDEISTNFSYGNKEIKITKMEARGPYFNFFTKGNVNLESKKVAIRGQVVPSLYGLNQLMGSMPLLKYMFGKRGGIVFTPFSFEDSF